MVVVVVVAMVMLDMVVIVVVAAAVVVFVTMTGRSRVHHLPPQDVWQLDADLAHHCPGNAMAPGQQVPQLSPSSSEE